MTMKLNPVIADSYTFTLPVGGNLDPGVSCSPSSAEHKVALFMSVVIVQYVDVFMMILTSQNKKLRTL